MLGLNLLRLAKLTWWINVRTNNQMWPQMQYALSALYYIDRVDGFAI